LVVGCWCVIVCEFPWHFSVLEASFWQHDASMMAA